MTFLIEPGDVLIPTDRGVGYRNHRYSHVRGARWLIPARDRWSDKEFVGPCGFQSIPMPSVAYKDLGSATGQDFAHRYYASEIRGAYRHVAQKNAV